MKMSEPLRYLAKCPWYSIELQAHPKGEFVLYSDYASLKAEVERLTELNATTSLRYDATKSMLDGCAKEIEEMEAEIERLKGGQP